MRKIIFLLLITFFITGCMRQIETPPPQYIHYNFSINTTNGFLTLYGNARGIEDLRFPLSSIKTTGASNVPGFETFIGGTYAYKFSPTIMEQAFISFQMPHSREENSDLYPHWHWTPTTTAVGNVTWCAEYTCANIGDTFPATGIFCVSDASNTVVNQHHITPSVPFANNFTGSSMCVVRMYRDATAVSDTYTGDAVLLEFDVHYIVNRPQGERVDEYI